MYHHIDDNSYSAFCKQQSPEEELGQDSHNAAMCLLLDELEGANPPYTTTASQLKEIT